MMLYLYALSKLTVVSCLILKVLQTTAGNLKNIKRVPFYVHVSYLYTPCDYYSNVKLLHVL